MNTLRTWLDALVECIGRLVSLSMLLILGISFTVVVLRYAFGVGLIWLQDSYVWLTSLFFIGMSGCALLHDRHVRVELFYSRLTARRQALVNAVGVVLLLWPTLLVITLTSIKPIARSWQFLEVSPNTGGLSFAYVHKSLIYVFCALLFLQGLSLLLSSLDTLRKAPRPGAQP